LTALSDPSAARSQAVAVVRDWVRSTRAGPVKTGFILAGPQASRPAHLYLCPYQAHGGGPGGPRSNKPLITCAGPPGGTNFCATWCAKTRAL